MHILLHFIHINFIICLLCVYLVSVISDKLSLFHKSSIKRAKGPSIKDVRTEGGRRFVQCGHFANKRKFFRCGRPHFL